MAKRGSGASKEKKTPVKLFPIERVNAGRVTDPWKRMESLIKEMSEKTRFEHLKKVKIRMFWTKDWKIDADGLATGAKVAKASERDRLLAEENGGESPDFFIILPKEQWPHLTDAEKEQRLFHELCRIRPSMDANGKQKFDTKDRPLWRLGRIPIVAFPEEIERFGIESVLGRNDRIKASADAANQPLFSRMAETGEPVAGSVKPSEAWKNQPITMLPAPPVVQSYLDAAGMSTIGKLSEHMRVSGQFWAKDLKVGGTRKPANFEQHVENAFEKFWKDNPQYK
jgi:hypothetical protein